MGQGNVYFGRGPEVVWRDHYRPVRGGWVPDTEEPEQPSGSLLGNLYLTVNMGVKDRIYLGPNPIDVQVVDIPDLAMVLPRNPEPKASETPFEKLSVGGLPLGTIGLESTGFIGYLGTNKKAYFSEDYGSSFYEKAFPLTAETGLPNRACMYQRRLFCTTTTGKVYLVLDISKGLDLQEMGLPEGVAHTDILGIHNYAENLVMATKQGLFYNHQRTVWKKASLPRYATDLLESSTGVSFQGNGTTLLMQDESSKASLYSLNTGALWRYVTVPTAIGSLLHQVVLAPDSSIYFLCDDPSSHRSGLRGTVLYKSSDWGKNCAWLSVVSDDLQTSFRGLAFNLANDRILAYGGKHFMATNDAGQSWVLYSRPDYLNGAQFGVLLSIKYQGAGRYLVNAGNSLYILREWTNGMSIRLPQIRYSSGIYGDNKNMKWSLAIGKDTPFDLVALKATLGVEGTSTLELTPPENPFTVNVSMRV